MADTRTKQLEQRLADLTTALNEANTKVKGLGAFAGMLVHELALRLKKGDQVDRKLAEQVVNALKSFGGSVNTETAARLKDL